MHLLQISFLHILCLYIGRAMFEKHPFSAFYDYKKGTLSYLKILTNIHLSIYFLFACFIPIIYSIGLVLSILLV